jgi:hypothetical protein
VIAGYVVTLGGDSAGGMSEGQTALYLLGLLVIGGLIAWVLK